MATSHWRYGLWELGKFEKDILCHDAAVESGLKSVRNLALSSNWRMYFATGQMLRIIPINESPSRTEAAGR